jgi:quercetin dioxygenase-like cupin family protein
MSFHKLDEQDTREQMPGFHGKFIHGDTVTIVHWDIRAGAALPEHSHPHEQISNLLEGEFEMTIDGQTQLMHQGHVAVVPSNATHSGRALTACRFIDVFQPVREDYRV